VVFPLEFKDLEVKFGFIVAAACHVVDLEMLTMPL